MVDGRGELVTIGVGFEGMGEVRVFVVEGLVRTGVELLSKVRWLNLVSAGFNKDFIVNHRRIKSKQKVIPYCWKL